MARESGGGELRFASFLCCFAIRELLTAFKSASSCKTVVRIRVVSICNGDHCTNVISISTIILAIIEFDILFFSALALQLALGIVTQTPPQGIPNTNTPNVLKSLNYN